MNKRRLLAILLCLVLLLPLAACANTQDSSLTESGESQTGSDQGDASSEDGSSDASGAESSGNDTINIALSNDAGSLDMAFVTTETYSAITCMQETLWDVTEDGEIIYILAESVEEVSDTEWIIHLREGVTFSNGSPFTASDIIFSVNKHNNSGAYGQARVSTIDPEATYAVDDYTLSLQLNAPSVTNWTKCAMFGIYDEETYDEDTAAQNPIGTGPYALDEYVPNSHIYLERRDDYWGELPDAKYLNFLILQEASQRVNALETGLVDVAPLAIEDADYAQSLEGFNVDSRYTGNYQMLGFNFGPNSFFYHNLEARQAVAHAIDRQAIIDAVYLGKGKVMHAAVVDLCFDYEDRFENMDSTYEIGYDPKLATELAESSGLTGHTISVITDGSAEKIKSAEIIQQMLGEIGVTLEILNYDTATVNQMLYSLDSDYDLSMGSGISPNRRVGDQLLNGVRYIPTLTVEGAFEGNMEYLEKAPLTMSTTDEAALSEILYEMLGVYEREVLHFSLCNTEDFNAYANKIDMSSVQYSVGNGLACYRFLEFVS